VTQSEASRAAGQARVTPSLQAPGVTQAAGPLDSAKLLGGARSVEITHNGAVYRLQATRLGKLILTK
jgi:hemin uptake protein HemP